jgi:hypothetical protein
MLDWLWWYEHWFISCVMLMVILGILFISLEIAMEVEATTSKKSSTDMYGPYDHNEQGYNDQAYQQQPSSGADSQRTNAIPTVIPRLSQSSLILTQRVNRRRILLKCILLGQSGVGKTSWYHYHPPFASLYFPCLPAGHLINQSINQIGCVCYVVVLNMVVSRLVLILRR